MITKEMLLSMISEEKEQYATYSQFCAQYKVSQNSLATTMHTSKLEVLEALLKMISKV